MHKDMLAVYKPGERWLKTVIEGDKVYYSKMTVEEYKATLDPDVVIIPYDEAIQLIRKENDKMCGPWEPTSKRDYDEAFCCMPPENYQNLYGVEIFRCCEYMTDNITRHYVCVEKSRRGKYYSAYRRTSTSYLEIVKEVKALCQ